MEKDRKEEIEKRMTELMAKGCQGRKPMYRMERYKETEQHKTLYEFFRANGLKPYGYNEKGEPDGYKVEAAFVMTLENELKGGITLVSHNEPGTLYIGGVALDQEARAHHLGSMLLMKVIEEAKVLKADRVYANLPLAPNFYMKQGFVWDETKERCLLLNL